MLLIRGIPLVLMTAIIKGLRSIEFYISIFIVSSKSNKMFKILLTALIHVGFIRLYLGY